MSQSLSLSLVLLLLPLKFGSSGLPAAKLIISSCITKSPVIVPPDFGKALFAVVVVDEGAAPKLANVTFEFNMLELLPVWYISCPLYWKASVCASKTSVQLIDVPAEPALLA